MKSYSGRMWFSVILILMCRRNVGIVYVCIPLQSSLCEECRSVFFKFGSHSDESFDSFYFDDLGPSPEKTLVVYRYQQRL